MKGFKNAKPPAPPPPPRKTGKAIWPLAPDAPLKITEVIRRKGHALTQKMIDSREPIGFVVIGSFRGAPAVRPIFRTETWVQHPGDRTKTRYIYGGYAVGTESYCDRNFMLDNEGCTLADVAARAINALQYRHIMSVRREKYKKTKPKGKKK